MQNSPHQYGTHHVRLIDLRHVSLAGHAHIQLQKCLAVSTHFLIQHMLLDGSSNRASCKSELFRTLNLPITCTCNNSVFSSHFSLTTDSVYFSLTSHSIPKNSSDFYSLQSSLHSRRVSPVWLYLFPLSLTCKHTQRCIFPVASWGGGGGGC